MCAGDRRVIVRQVVEVLASVVGVGGDRQLKNNGVGVHGWQRTHETCPADDDEMLIRSPPPSRSCGRNTSVAVMRRAG
jgi:hypothetical protein